MPARPQVEGLRSLLDCGSQRSTTEKTPWTDFKVKNKVGGLKLSITVVLYGVRESVDARLETPKDMAVEQVCSVHRRNQRRRNRGCRIYSCLR